MKRNKNLGILILRLAIPFTMLIYGINKVIEGTGFIGSLFEQYGLPKFIANGIFIGEIVAPLMLMMGFRTRLAGLIFSFNCLVAIVMAQTQNIFKLNQFGGWSLDLLFIYLMAGIVFYVSGAGKYALSTSNHWD
ncbi:DoxX family protein [Aurantibacter crassamenti]|uniref:DoxX family protein n=1 Tax=Aurantibacter crassamenti TaxID=1837375 RepID=UPI0019397726|nr:DoxX family protein [Aurantibacter crassamenti]MBM1107792.1 DoxX family protein [Aurantibacter crassamenti]